MKFLAARPMRPMPAFSMLAHTLLSALFLSDSHAASIRNRSLSQSASTLDVTAHSSGASLPQQMPDLHKAMLSFMNDDDDTGTATANLLGNAVNYLSDDSPAAETAQDGEEDPEQDDAPPQPDPIYAGGDAAAGFLERQSGIGLTPEGAQSDLDVSPSQRKALINAFDERPDLFGHCMLIHDFATPLRVGSAIMKRLSTPEDDGSTAAATEQDTATDDSSKDPEEIPDTILRVKGGIVDRDAGSSEDATPEVTMFAFLQSVAGEVAVIPNGGVARWSSKKKVPIAGYLCNEKGNMVLYTLPTPCLATTLGDDGMPRSAPRPSGPAPASASAPAPAAAVPPSGVANKTALLSIEHQGGLDPEQAEPATKDDFVVYVGNKKLYFGSKLKAEKFCMHLTDSIADDMGDHEFDTDIAAVDHVRKDASAAEFVQLVRRPVTKEWTVGTKSLLVVVVDWMRGDRSRRPYSKQTQTVSHYRDKVFPRVRSAFQRMSYGQFDLVPTFVPEVIRFARPRSRYTARGYPFPGMYIGAQEGLENSRFASSYNFADYDFVYVISPQQSPVGTKGVAWVGAKGAICNGCEAISENFQVMVAVHELGHNLGLAHAGSKSLEYGNPFDWMGNYPDVTGLSYGAGYKLRLHWLPPTTVAQVTDRDLGSLNDKFIIQPFDVDQAPKAGELVAIQISLRGNSRDLFITYRHSLAGTEAGVYVVMQDKGKPDSELIDMACHTPSQRDARLHTQWTYLDPSSKVVIYLESINDRAATLHVFAAPQSQIGAIRARPTFTDGKYKCPRTCTDSDLLVAQFKGCSVLAGQGYCKGGKITSGGKSLSIGMDLCPKSCGKCDAVLAGSTVIGGRGSGCSDRKIRIGGKNCYQARRAGLCDRDTNIGNIGRDLCPKSCGKCPPAPRFGSSAGSFANPTPARTHGVAGTSKEEAAPPPPATTTVTVPVAGGGTCTDDSQWADKDGDGCAVYADFIAKGKLSQKQACNFGAGGAKDACKMTCGVCEQAAETSTATPMPPTDAPAAPQAETEKKQCEDSDCVKSWKDSFGQCFKCDEFKDTYCGKDALFMQSCPKSCNLCSEKSQACADDFKQATCEEWQVLGFCDQPKVVRACKQTCGLCEHMSAASIQGGEEGATLQKGDAVDSAALEAVADDNWEYGSQKALKKPAKIAKKALRPKSEQSAAVRSSPVVQIVVAFIATSVLCHL